MADGKWKKPEHSAISHLPFTTRPSFSAACELLFFSMHPQFSSATLTFLRALKRNNDREWFKARRDRYERDVRGPMIAVIERLASDLKRFAPDLVAAPKVSLYRIYRDTRFSPDKTPLKTYISAVFPHRVLLKKQGAGLYFEVAPGWVWMGGGIYAPEPKELLRVRKHIAATWPQLDRIVRGRRFASDIGALTGERVSRVPRGFPRDHPAAEYLKHRQFLAGREFPAELATTADFYPTLLRTFSAAAPLIAFLNEAIVSEARI
jgi:uncharacterized protein (TIGR02453 family)